MKTTLPSKAALLAVCLWFGLCALTCGAPFTLDCGYYAPGPGGSIYHPCLLEITQNCDTEGSLLDPGTSYIAGLPSLPGVPGPQYAPPGPGTLIPNPGAGGETCCGSEPGGPTGPYYSDNYSDIGQCRSCGTGGGGVPIYDAVGMPSWSVTEPALTFWLRDVPVWTQPGRGNPLKFKLTYKQRVLYDSLSNVFGFGPAWTGNFQTYATPLTDHTNKALVQQGDGSTVCYDIFAGNNYYSGARFSLRAGGGYELMYRGGTDQIFTNLFTVSGIARYFLSSYDPGDGSPGTSFNYLQTNGAVRLTSVRDRAGHDTTFSYTSAQNYGALISQIATPGGATAGFAYNANGYLTNITDACGNLSQLCYNAAGQLTNLITPYGSTSFYFTNGSTNWEVLWVQEYGLRSYLFVYLDEDTTGRIPTGYTNEVPSTGAIQNHFDTTNLHKRNSFYWGPRQFELLSASVKASLSNATFTPNVLTNADFLRARQRHWLLQYGASSGPASTTISLERRPSADGTTPGAILWYDYVGKTGNDQEGSQKQPCLVAWKRPDGQSAYVDTTRNSWGLPTVVSQTYSAPDGSVALATQTYDYDYGPLGTGGNHLIAFTDALGNQTTYGYANGHLAAATNALGYESYYGWNNSELVAFTNGPQDVFIGQFYRHYTYGDTNHPGLPTEVVEPPDDRTHSYTYSNGLVLTETSPSGLTVTNLYDGLGRRVCVQYPDGTYTSNAYAVLHLAGTRDRLGNWTRYGYDSHGRLLATTNALGNISAFSYCNCGSLEATTDALNNTTSFTYDDLGRRLRTTRPDSTWSENQFNLLDEVTKVSDSSGYCVTHWYNNQGLLYASSNAAGVVNFRQFDAVNRATQTVGSDGVVVTNAFDALGRLLRISRNSDAIVEEFEYGFTGLLAATRDLQTTYYLNDVAGRRLYEENPNLEETWYGYDVADRLVSVTDPQNNSTQWGYDAYGHVTLKLDANGQSMFTYAYDAEGRLTNRWTPAKGNTGYAYDALGNLTNVDYPTSPDLHLSYDALSRLTNLVDAVGITRYQYTSAGQLQSEDGPFDNDMVSYGYTNRLRSSVSLPDAAGGTAWTQGYGYDTAARLASVSSPAGVFGYTYGTTPANRPFWLNLPGGSQIGYTYDALARLTGTELKDPTGTSLHRHTYAYASQTDRIATMSRLDGSSVDYGYDPVGQLVAASGYLTYTTTRRVHEQFSYGYDGAGNLASRNTSGFTEQFTVNNLNQLTGEARGDDATLTVAGATTAAASSVIVNGSPASVYSDHTFALDGFTPIDGTNTFTAVATDALGRGDTNTVVVNLPAAVSFAYDANGNMTTNGTRIFEYDDENQLIRITEPTAWRSVFTYDGKMRRRERWESVWDGMHWVSNLLVRYVYDGNLVLQERQYDPRLTTSVPQRSVSYTRGRDLSGGFQGAGGIGGLLARTDSGFSAQPSVYYHCDNVGNVTALVNSGGTLVGRYWYDPFGNTLALAGAAAEANLYRFSSKEWHEKSGIAYYLYRYYAPNLQRWLNRDPVGEYGGYNLYRFCRNQTTRDCDAFGLKGWPSTCSELFNSGNLNWAKDLARHVIKRIGRYCGAPDVGHYQTIASHCHGVARFIELWQKCQGPLTKAQQSAMTGALAEVVKAATACSKVRPPSEDQIAVEGASATSLQAVFEPLNPPAPDAIAITVPPPIRIPFPIFGW